MNCQHLEPGSFIQNRRSGVSGEAESSGACAPSPLRPPLVPGPPRRWAVSFPPPVSPCDSGFGRWDLRRQEGRGRGPKRKWEWGGEELHGGGGVLEPGSWPSEVGRGRCLSLTTRLPLHPPLPEEEPEAGPERRSSFQCLRAPWGLLVTLTRSESLCKSCGPAGWAWEGGSAPLVT